MRLSLTTESHQMNSIPNSGQDVGLVEKEAPQTEETNILSTGAAESGDHGEKEVDMSCGYRWFKPACCQHFLDIRIYVVFITLSALVHAIAAFGFVQSMLSTIERRYELTSTETGLIASCYDIIFVILALPISYLGGHGNKPRYLGIGGIVFGCGNFVFALPHLMSGHYQAEQNVDTLCGMKDGMKDPCEKTTTVLEDQAIFPYKYVFMFGSMLHGAGATPLLILGISYIDENVAPRLAPFYNGIFFTGQLVGGAIGYMWGSEILNFYVDLDVDPKKFGLDPENPKWVGAWWLGFLVTGTISFVLALPLLAFPAKLPGYKELEIQRRSEVGASRYSEPTRDDSKRSFRGILLSLRVLVFNSSFMWINVAETTAGFIVGGYAAFMPKIIEYKFGVTPYESAFYMGSVVVPIAGAATFLGGFIVQLCDLRMRAILKLCIGSALLALACSFPLLLECESMAFAGVNLDYNEPPGKSTFQGFGGDNKLGQTCNKDCNCNENVYAPMCGRDDVIYFSPCYAGCTEKIGSNNLMKFTNCSCVAYKLTKEDQNGGDMSQGEFQKCHKPCKWLPHFMAVFSFQTLFICIISMPSMTATLRIVPTSHRSTGLGFQYVFSKIMGNIPAPITFGKIFDLSCLLWQKQCDGTGACLFYNQEQMSLHMTIITGACSLVTLAGSVMALVCYAVQTPLETTCEQKSADEVQTSVTDNDLVSPSGLGGISRNNTM